MQLQKTYKAYGELRPGVRTLGQRERTMLLLADGRRSLYEFSGMFDGEGQQIVIDLINRGYLAPAAPHEPQTEG